MFGETCSIMKGGVIWFSTSSIEILLVGISYHHWIRTFEISS